MDYLLHLGEHTALQYSKTGITRDLYSKLNVDGCMCVIVHLITPKREFALLTIVFTGICVYNDSLLSM
jgi:hypothetical protein